MVRRRALDKLSSMLLSSPGQKILAVGQHGKTLPIAEVAFTTWAVSGLTLAARWSTLANPHSPAPTHPGWSWVTAPHRCLSESHSCEQPQWLCWWARTCLEPIFIGPVFMCQAGGWQWSKILAAFRERLTYSFLSSLKLPTEQLQQHRLLQGLYISEPPQSCLLQGWCFFLCEAKANSIKANYAMQTLVNSFT